MNKYIKVLIGLFIGGILGYGYFYFFGCNSSSCSLNSNWHFPTIFGAVVGLVLSFPNSKNVDKKTNETNNN